MTYAIAIDIGGTCTDCVAVDSQGRMSLSKTFSTPPDFSLGIITGLELLASAAGKELADLLAATTIFLHSTTVAENAIVDGTMATAGLITTSGFEDTLFAMRGGFGRWSGLSELEKRDPVRTDKPRPLIPRALIRGLRERTGSRGEQLFEPDPKQIEQAVPGAARRRCGEPCRLPTVVLPCPRGRGTGRGDRQTPSSRHLRVRVPPCGAFSW
jgi:N-methylhydantoinase A